MTRSPQLTRVLRAWRLAQHCRARSLRARDVLEIEQTAAARGVTRREFIGASAAAVAAAAVPLRAAAPRVAIVGAGLAGLACADRLQAKGVQAVVYEASSRLGGRCFSNRTLVSGMACENGGELVDTAHKTVLAYAKQFGLALESYVKKRGEEGFWFFGRAWSDAEVVDEFREVVASMQTDLRAISGSATFDSHNAADVTLDRTDLATYFATRTTGHTLIEAVLNEAYLAEYGLETWQQSTLNFLGFMRLNRQSKFEPFGVSDERFHLIDGNDGIVRGLSQKLRGPLLTGARLTRLGRDASGRYRLYFNGAPQPETADAVVLAVPFTVLRQVVLDASLALSPAKQNAIATLGYGTNAKTMVAFTGRPWEELHGSGGGTYSDLANLQATWESNRGRATRFGIVTDYASGERGAGLSTEQPAEPGGRLSHGLRHRPARHQGACGDQRRQIRRASGALAVESVVARFVHLLSAGPVHLGGRARGAGGRSAQVRRRARGLVLFLSGLHGRSLCERDPRRQRDPGGHQDGRHLGRVGRVGRESGVGRRQLLRQGAWALAAAALPVTPRAAGSVSPVMTALSDYMAAAKDRALPGPIVEHTVHHVLDTVAAMISGAELPPGRAALTLARAEAGRPVATVVASSTVDRRRGCRARQRRARAFGRDRRFAQRVAVASRRVGRARGAGDGRGRSASAARHYLRAVALGYDVGTRMTMALGGSAFRDSTRRSTHAYAGTFGSAAAAGCAAGFDAQRMRWLLDYASQQAGGYAVWGRDTDHIEKGFVFGGMPARNGVTAALLVRAGWNGVDDVFSGDDDFFQVNAPAGDRSVLVARLGERFEIANTDIKKWTVGTPIQAPLDALENIRKRRPFTAGEVKSVAVRLAPVGGRRRGQPRHARHLPAAHDGGDARWTARRRSPPRTTSRGCRIPQCSSSGRRCATCRTRRWRSCCRCAWRSSR